MAYAVVVAPEVVAQVATIAAWWAEHRLAAPRLFQTELDTALVRIAEYPELGVAIRRRGRPGLRGLTLRRSGYVVMFEVNASSGV